MKNFVSVLLAGALSLGAGSLPAQDLFEAIKNGDMAGVKALVESNRDLLKAPNKDKFLPLTFASRLGKEDIVRYFLAQGADVDATDGPTFTPVTYAVQRGHLPVIKLLADGGADLRRLTLGMSLLHTAVKNSNRDVIELLLSKGGDINQRDKFGLTPLHMAAELGLIEMCRLLLSRGAEADARADDGATAWHLAQDALHPEIAELLETKGTKRFPRAFPAIAGRYLGATKPGNALEPFLPNRVLRIVGPHSGIAVSPDGKEIFWVRGDYSGKIWWTKEIDGVWQSPRMADFSGPYDNSYPSFSVDGRRLFFTSDRPRGKDGKRDEGVGDIWYVEKNGKGWGEPENAGPEINTNGDEFIATQSRDQAVYFTRVAEKDGKRSVDIYRAEYLNGKYLQAERLGPAVNTPQMDVGPFVSPDGGYMLFSSEKFGGMTTCVSFRNRDGSWTPAINAQSLFAPFAASYPQGITGDGKYILYAGRTGNDWDIYWMSARVVEDLRPGRK